MAAIETENTLSKLFNVRLTPETKKLWDSAAETEEIPLSEFVRAVVTERALALAATAAPVATSKTCVACGADMPMDASTCPDCGSDQTDVVGYDDDGEMLADEAAETAAEITAPWEGVMGTIGSPTEDGRYLIPDKVANRELPVEMHMQPALASGHDGAVPVGRIDEISYIPFADFEHADDFYSEDQIANMPDHAVVVWGSGELNGPHAEIAQQRIANGADVSIDGLHLDGSLYDAETFSEIDPDELGMDGVLNGIFDKTVLQGMSGDIGGLTIVGIGAFKEAHVAITASGSLRLVEEKETAAERFATLVAAAGPLKPPREWFENPQLRELTPLQITKDGRVFGHLCDWNGCHTGFSGICVPPFHSPSNYAYFNVGELEMAEGDLVPCGKLMFSMDGGKHAPVDASMSYQDVQHHYDDATKVGAFVRAGADRFGTWLAGALRPGLTDIEIQHLRAHPPSGDWRPIRGSSDLVAAFSVAVPGFPIPRPQSMVASAGESLVVITAPLMLDEEQLAYGARRRKRLKEAMGMPAEKSRAEMRRELAEQLARPAEVEEEETEELSFEGPYDDGLEDLAEITADQRRAWAKSGVAMNDGSYPITKCTGDGTSAVNARRAIGRAPASKRAAVKAHIATREKALGCSNGD